MTSQSVPHGIVGGMTLSSGSTGLSVAGLFAGIGGIEEGLGRAGHHGVLLCEVEPLAQSVLRSRYPAVELWDDVTTLPSLPRADIVAAGFPCQDLSQAGRTAGIGGRNSGLVDNVFRLLEGTDDQHPRWLVLENVPFMLQLDRGRAMKYLTSALERLGFMWAYRVVDTRAFGLPHRRQRVIVVASRVDDPRGVLFADEAGEPVERDDAGKACGFYWTEGIRGLGWAVDAVPTLKGGSTIGIPSPPAILMPDGTLVTPDIRDAERLQGFNPKWTDVDRVDGKPVRVGHRWKLVGNAVSVPVFEWVGHRLAAPGTFDNTEHEIIQDGDRWPKAAWGVDGKVRRVSASAWPVRRRFRSLKPFLRYVPRPLSDRAVQGFHSRMASSSLRFPQRLVEAMDVRVAEIA